MNRAQACAILDLPRAQAVDRIMALAAKAERWEAWQTQGAANTPISPTTPSAMTPVYLKPAHRGRRKTPGRKPGHAGAWRRTPPRLNARRDHRLRQGPHCATPVGKSIRQHPRVIEDIPPVTPQVTAHTVPGYWCGQCKKIVTPAVTAALPHSTLGLRLVVYTAWRHYLIGVSVGNWVKTAAVSLGFPVSPGGLTLAWKQLATLLEGHYDALGETIRRSAVLHADETGWRVNGVTFWLWAFATRHHGYYLIDRHRGAAVVHNVLGTLFPGILITDFWGAYNAIESLAKQRCYFHLFTELRKVDLRNTSRPWRRFRKTRARLLKDAVRLGAQRHARAPPTYARRRAKLHQRLNPLIAAVYADADARRLIKRLRRHPRELLTFLDHDDVSPYNNHAEQPLRPAVHTRKVSQQNRSLDGANTHAIMLSLFRTAHLQRLNPIDQVLHLAQTTLADRATSTILHTNPVSQAA